ncbi:MAG: type VI secretion system-associated FHA domain protein TagH [Alphaproteobacteria bacterium]|nr:type VI secretion system-associated FHA domain protein TagH [Alphaproteobacteria bacterium]MCL2453252.1 type VI secretion system-associated FHA domain protein TagH [Alphaproteobacteria bacterium]
MRLTLAIENHDHLPDGGPLSITVAGGRGLDIGRDQFLDWTLPDPDRFISGKHCEIRPANGEYLLYDVSTNGTFLNGSDNRMQSPYRLRSGDRLTIGQYIIAVTVETDSLPQTPPQGILHRPVSYEELWAADEEAAPPIPRSELQPKRLDRRPLDDWIDRPADLPPPLRDEPPHASNPFEMEAGPHSDQDADWAPFIPKPQPVPPAPPSPPTPRRNQSFEEEQDRTGTSTAPSWPSEPSPVAQDGAAEAKRQPQELSSAEGEPAHVPHDAPQNFSFPQFLASFAMAAEIPPQGLQGQSAEEFGEKLGALIRLLTIEMKQLLDARSETRRVTRSTQHTMIQAQGNNPLKFSPTAEDALRIMLGPSTRSYLDAPRAFAQGFSDLKKHQLQIFSAMQKAMRLIAEDLDPAAFEREQADKVGWSVLPGSRKARLWDAYMALWKAKTLRHDDGLVSVFMQYFSTCYDQTDPQG